MASGLTTSHRTASVPDPPAPLCDVAHTTRQTPLAKARELIEAGQVTLVSEAVTYDVGRYQVTLRADGPRCDCPATVTCKHINAAAILHLAASESCSVESMWDPESESA